MKNAGVAYCLLGICLGCSGKSGECTLIGCNDQFIIVIGNASGTRPNLAADLVIDGRAVSCPAPGTGTQVTCDSGVTVSSYELQACTESQSGGMAMETCVGTGTYAERIVLVGAPKVVSVSLRSSTVTVAQQDFQPAYVSNQPNGLGCDPICKQATATWTI
jgi:hypothetical protein